METGLLHESANQTRGKRLDTRGSCPTFTGLTTPPTVTMYLHIKGLSTQEIHEDTKYVLGDNASSQVTIYRWTYDTN